jgi:hypothetical protein
MATYDDQSELVEALRCCVAESELVQDIAEACRVTGVKVQDIAAWSVSTTAERLFLTDDEAHSLILECRARIHGKSQASLWPSAPFAAPFLRSTCAASMF